MIYYLLIFFILQISTVFAIAPSEIINTTREESVIKVDNIQDIQMLTKDFHVDQSLIDSLREKNLSYGEIHHILSISKHLPGGITKDNIQKVLDARKAMSSKDDWNALAHQLGTKLDDQFIEKPLTTPNI